MNVVFIPSIQSKHLTDVDSYSDYSLKTWKHYCDRIGAKLFVMNEPIHDPDKMKVTWQRWYVHDLLEHNNIDYDKIFMVDLDTMIRWDAPNIFEDEWIGKNSDFAACVDNENLRLVNYSVEGYQHLFNDVSLDWERYFNCGVIFMTKKMAKISKTITDFYFDNEEEILKLQHETLKKGSDQTPVNYIVNREMSNVNLLSKRWNLTHLMRKEILNGLYVKHCGQPMDVIQPAMERDNFMTAEQAKEFGLVDQIVEQRPDN